MGIGGNVDIGGIAGKGGDEGGQLNHEGKPRQQSPRCTAKKDEKRRSKRIVELQKQTMERDRRFIVNVPFSTPAEECRIVISTIFSLGQIVFE